MREFRFLVPPTMVYLTWTLASYFYEKTFVFNLGGLKLEPLLISLPAIGFLISQVSIFAINVCDFLISGKFSSRLKLFLFCKNETFYFMDVERKVDIVEAIYPFLQREKTSEANTRLWFVENMKLGQDELPKWLERRWSMVMTNLNTFVALIFTWVFFSKFYNIGVFTGFFPRRFLLVIVIILLFNLAKAWKDIRLVESDFFEKLRSDCKKDS